MMIPFLFDRSGYANQRSLNHLCAPESSSEFERLATDYDTGRVKKEFRGRSPLGTNSYSRFELCAIALALRNK